MDGWMEMLEVAFATCKGSGWHVYNFDLRENFYEFENSWSCVLRLPVIQLPPMLQRDQALQPAVPVLRNATWPRIAVLICPLWRERNPWIQKQVWRSFCESLVTWHVTTASTHHHDATFIAWLGCVQHDFSGYLLWSNFRHLIWPTVSGVWCSIV